MNILQKIKAIWVQIKLLQAKLISHTMEDTIYAIAKESLGKHITLNESVPSDVGCAEAVSYILKKAGALIPPSGIPGTASLLAWLEVSPDFIEVDIPEPGAVIVSATGSGNGNITGHTGILGKKGAMYTDDYGVLSNDSATGIFRELWSYRAWVNYYQLEGGMKVRLFRGI